MIQSNMNKYCYVWHAREELSKQPPAGANHPDKKMYPYPSCVLMSIWEKVPPYVPGLLSPGPPRLSCTVRGSVISSSAHKLHAGEHVFSLRWIRRSLQSNPKGHQAASGPTFSADIFWTWMSALTEIKKQSTPAGKCERENNLSNKTTTK